MDDMQFIAYVRARQKYRVQYKRKFYGCFSDLDKAKERRAQVLKCIADGVPVPTLREMNAARKAEQAAEKEKAKQATERRDKLEELRQREAAKFPIVVPYDERPRFEGKTQAQRDYNACKRCKWSCGDHNKLHCLYHVDEYHKPRLYMHYVRTGKQSLKGFTHGEYCTEWEPYKTKKHSFEYYSYGHDKGAPK